MGIMLQLWEDGDQKGRSVLINLPLVKAPRNVMPVNLCQSCESYSTTVEELFTPLAHPGDDPKARQTPKFMG